MVDVCVVYVYTRSMHLPLNGKVYGVVRNIYIIGAGSTLLVYCGGFPKTLISGQVTGETPALFLLYASVTLMKDTSVCGSRGYSTVCHDRTYKVFQQRGGQHPL